MKRLTGRRDGRAYIVGCPDFTLPKIVGLIIQQTVDRLAAYESTGLEPEEIISAIDMAKIACALHELNAYKELGSIDRLRELAQADRDGRCVVLPAKVDETVYQAKKGDDCPCCFHLEGANISEDGDITYPMYWGERFTPDDFGTKLFRTHGEAMAALRREQDG